MKPLALVPALAALALMPAQTPNPSPKTPDKLASAIFDWEKLSVNPTPKGARRDVFDGPTATVDKAHCHITTLNPGENSGEPRRHLQEEIIVIKEGTVEASLDGKTQIVGAGSILYFAAHAVTRLRNAGATPATYFVINYYTPLTPKS